MKIVGINEYKIYRAVVELGDGTQREFDIDENSAMLFARELVLEAREGQPQPTAPQNPPPVIPQEPVPGMVQLDPDTQMPENTDGLYEGLSADESVGPEGSGSI